MNIQLLKSIPKITLYITNKLKLNFFIYFKKNFIVTSENINAKIIALKFKIERLISSLNKIFFNPKIDTAPKVGIESKKEILAASNLLKLSNLAAVIVTPDLLTPGINEKI